MIRLQGVTKSLGQKPVLRGVNLDVPRGCLYGLIGPGASGKSVLLKVIAGLIRPDSGAVSVDGQDLARMDEPSVQEFRKCFGMLFQNNALFDYMSVAENIAFPLRQLTQLSEADVQARVNERLDRVALKGFGHRFPAALSGGQKKRVGVARATVTQSAILLYDEPAAGLDPVTSQRIFNLLRSEQQATAATVVMVSSDLDRLLSVTDRVGMVHNGKMLFQGTTAEALASTEPFVRQFVHGEVEGPL
ncbi:MAG TPA: ATP-binding cassette domain-containing protein [Polyangiaceae bacterium]|nr:ATP-binding cassette domain-containing protein [Polyangiaceae bacterium]